MNRLFYAETFLNLLVIITIFALICLGYLQWQSQQNRQVNFIFQQQQALQIAENQLARKMAAVNCESAVEQNQLRFFIECQPNKIEVKFPLGSVVVTADS